MDCFGSDPPHDQPIEELSERTGTIFLGPIDFSPSPYWDRPALRQAIPVARFGNAFVFRGTFYLPGQAAAVMYWRGIAKLYLQKPDEAAAEKAFLRSVELDPTAYFVYIQLGNLYLKRGHQERALRAYSDALKFAGNDSHFHSQIQEQMQRVSAENLANIAPLRDPIWNDVYIPAARPSAASFAGAPRWHSPATWNPAAVSMSRYSFTRSEAGLPCRRPRYGTADEVFCGTHQIEDAEEFLWMRSQVDK